MTTIQTFPRNLRVRGKTPRVEHVTRSYPLLLRDGILTRVKALPYFATGFTFTTNKMLQIQARMLPVCGVYFLQETGMPDGDANAGEPRFRTTVRIGFSVIILNNDPEAAEDQLDRAMQVLAGGLLSDPTLYNNSLFQIQGYVSGARTHVFGNASSDNETPVAELRWELVCDLGTLHYPPIVTDDLEVIHVTTEYPHGNHDAPPIIREYDLEQ